MAAIACLGDARWDILNGINHDITVLGGGIGVFMGRANTTGLTEPTDAFAEFWHFDAYNTIKRQFFCIW